MDPHNPIMPQGELLSPHLFKSKDLDRISLDEGPAILEWPSELSPESVKELEYWFIGLINRARRRVGLEKITIDKSIPNNDNIKSIPNNVNIS